MKKVIRIFFILSLVTLALVGCSGSDETNAKKVAEEFITGISNVDEAKVTAYNTPLPDITGDVNTEEYNKKQNEAFFEVIKSVDKNIIHLITEEGYKVILANQFNTATTRICADGNYTAQVTDITLGENIYKDYEDKNTVRYYYETKLKFITTDGKTEKTDTSKGAIELIKVNGQWKVKGFGIRQLPKLDK